MRFLRWPVVAALLAPFAPAQTEPTAEETEVLCWVNRFRRDPQAFGRLVLDGDKPDIAAHVDWKMFAAEIAALRPAPPVFFDSRLIDASRNHARYMVEAREYGHGETPGRPGFTGESPSDRARAAGYVGNVAECSFANGGATPFAIVAGYIVDAEMPGKGTGGMQEGRGHRSCMIDPKWRDAGVGLFAWGAGQVSNVALYGEATDLGRALGGVAIEDRDGDAFYDVGEGLGGVHVAAGELGAVSTASGAWRLDLPRGATPKKLVARFGSLELVREIAAGSDNLQIDLLFEVRRNIAELEAELAKVPDTLATRQRALRLRLLELRAAATPAETELATEVDALERTVLAGLGTWARVDADNTFHAAKRSFAGTVVEDWIEQAQVADTLARAAAAARTTKNAAERTKRARATAADLERKLPGITSADLWRTLTTMRRELLAM